MIVSLMITFSFGDFGLISCYAAVLNIVYYVGLLDKLTGGAKTVFKPSKDLSSAVGLMLDT